MRDFLPFDRPVLVIVGPSGVGKSTIVEKLIKDSLIELTPTWTDRPRRSKEKTLEHRFVSAKEFNDLASKGFFLHEPVSYFGLPYFYALPRLLMPAAGKVPAIMARIMSLPLLDHYYPNRIIYQIEAPLEDVADRLQQRNRDGAELGRRLADYDKEILKGRRHSTRVFTNDSSIESITNQVAEALGQDFNIARQG